MAHVNSADDDIVLHFETSPHWECELISGEMLTENVARCNDIDFVLTSWKFASTLGVDRRELVLIQ